MIHTQISPKIIEDLQGFDSMHLDAQFVEQDISELVQSIQLLESIFPSWVFMLCPIKHDNFHYVSENSQQILGYSADYMCNLSITDYLNKIHPEDVKGVQLALEYMCDHTRQRSDQDPTSYRFSLHYRLRVPGRRYAHVLAEKRAYKNRVGRYAYFTLIKNETDQRPYNGVKLEVYERTAADYCKVDEYMPFPNKGGITSREKEVLRCIRQGLTSKQIADKLSISIFTVRNHRSNVFEKAGAQNMVQLVQHAEVAGWI